jgi:signal transduction histidine kinase
MSHEIRTPINSILSYTQLLKDETINTVPEDLKFSFDMINNGGRRLIRTVDLILNMSELQTGTYEVIIENCNIMNVLQQLVGEFQTAAKSKNLDLMLLNRLDNNECELLLDIYTVTQIFANLIDNAIKYTVKGSIEVVAYKTKDYQIAIDVQDSGIGISKKFQETLFEPFTQEEQGYTRKFEGNGLGMALVKEYCKLNNAHISVESEKGCGSIFTVTFLNSYVNPQNDLEYSSQKLINIKSVKELAS